MELLVSTNNIDVQLLPGELVIGHVKTEHVELCVGFLFQVVQQDARGWPDSLRGEWNGDDTQSEPEDDSDALRYIFIQDEEGLMMVLSELHRKRLAQSSMAKYVTWSDSPTWRALEIHMGPSGVETPGIVSFISSTMSKRSISILNFTSFGADVLLIRSHDVDSARACFEDIGGMGVTGLQNLMSTAINLSNESPQQQTSSRDELQQFAGTFLSVDPATYTLCSLRREMVQPAVYTLLNKVLTNCAKHNDLTPTEEKCAADASEKQQEVKENQQQQQHVNSKQLIWGLMSTTEEVTLLTDADDVDQFPGDALIACPQRFKAIKLCGKQFAFKETGVVKLMSAPYKIGVVLLNFSTFATNVSLVQEKDLHVALKSLQDALGGR